MHLPRLGGEELSGLTLRTCWANSARQSWCARWPARAYWTYKLSSARDQRSGTDSRIGFPTLKARKIPFAMIWGFADRAEKTPSGKKSATEGLCTHQWLPPILTDLQVPERLVDL